MDFHWRLLPLLPWALDDQQPRLRAVGIWRRSGTDFTKLYQVPLSASPYIYSLFNEAVTTGMPVQSSLAIDHPHDYKIYDGQFHNQYLLGPSLLVAPTESTKDFVKVYLPEGEWYSLYNGQKFFGNTEIIVESPVHRLPVFVKAGSIIPMQPVKSNTHEATDTLNLHVYIGPQRNTFSFMKMMVQLSSINRASFPNATSRSIPPAGNLP